MPGSIFTENTSHDFEVIVVDNASTVDETIAIRAEYPVSLRFAVRRIWFAGANNLGSGMPPRLSFSS